MENPKKDLQIVFELNTYKILHFNIFVVIKKFTEEITFDLSVNKIFRKFCLFSFDKLLHVVKYVICIIDYYFFG